MECAVCEKTFYGHADVSGEVVCGSCALTSTAKGKKKPKPANIESMQGNLFKESMKEPERNEAKEPKVSKIKVKSNYARNRVVVISGNVVLAFNEDGECSIEAKHREALEAHMSLRPNRFSIVEKVAPSGVSNPEPAPEPVVVDIVDKEPEPAPEPEVVEEKPAEPKKKAAKKPKKTSKKRKKKSGK